MAGGTCFDLEPTGITAKVAGMPDPTDFKKSSSGEVSVAVNDSESYSKYRKN